MSTQPDNISADISDSERTRLKLVGQITQELSPSFANAIAGVILGVMAFGGGAYALFCAVRAVIASGGNLPMDTKIGWSWIAVGLGSLVSVVLMGIGCVLFLMARWVFRRRVYICEQGFCDSDGSKVRVFPWTEIESIHEIVIQERLPIVKGPAKFAVPVKTSRSYVIRRRDGEQCRMAPGTVTKFKYLEDLLRNEAEQRNIPWAVVQ